jgi:polyferredoxin
MSRAVIIYEFPKSQECMECKHGSFIHGEGYENSNYICEVGEERNKGSKCSSKEVI